MIHQLPAHAALCRLLACAWDIQQAPDPALVPWVDVAGLVGRGNLAGLLHTLTAAMREAIPPPVRLSFEQAHYATIAANVRTLEQLGQVRAALGEVGAPVLLLKGAALTETLYAALGPRHIGDIDLLVPREVVPACRAVLLRLGYAPQEAEVRPGTHLAYRYEECFTPPANAETAVELHWHLLDVPWYAQRVPVDWFWGHSAARSFAGQPFQALDDVANLVYLPAHLALHHAFAGLHARFDLALLIAQGQPRLDWDRVIAAARAFELVSALRGSLERLGQDWPSLPLEEPRRLLADVAPSRNDARLYRLLTTQSHSTPLSVYTTLVALPGPGARVRYLRDNVFPQPAYMRARYPVRRDWHLPFWYAYRALAGLVRYVRALPGLLRRGDSTA